MRERFTKKWLTIGTALCVLFLAACGGTAELPDEIEGLPESSKLIVYTSHQKDVYEPIVREFESRTGIWVEIVYGGTKESLERLQDEAGKGTCDIMFGGGVESYGQYSSLFEPYESSLSSYLDPSYASEDHLYTVFSELPIVFIYNKNLITEEEAPAHWRDFLSDQWEGKVAFADPNTSGTSYTALAAMIQITGMDPRTLISRFQDVLGGNVSENSSAVLEEVSYGTRSVGITLEASALSWNSRGANLGIIYPAEGTTAVPDGIALVKNAPHRENAEKFIDFVISSDVQQIVVDELYRHSVREDVEQSAGLPSFSRVQLDLEKASESQEEIIEIWNSLAQE